MYKLYNSLLELACESTCCKIMTNTTVSDARNNLPELLNRVGFGQERILIERHGKPIAAIVSLEDLKRLEALEDAVDSAELRKAVAENSGFVALESIIDSRGE